MYDYVLQYGFDSKTESYIQSIKDYLKHSGVKDRERNWLPHITIDLYNCKNKELKDYMIEKRRNRNYIPHATLCTSDTLDKSIQLAKEKFNPFVAKVKYIWVYDRSMELIKVYDLK